MITTETFCDVILSDIINYPDIDNTGILIHLMGYPSVLWSNDYLTSTELIKYYLNNTMLQMHAASFSTFYMCNPRNHPFNSTIEILEILKDTIFWENIFYGENVRHACLNYTVTRAMISDNYLCGAIAAFGDIETLKWAMINDEIKQSTMHNTFVSDMTTTETSATSAPGLYCNIYEYAAKYNQLGMIKYLRRYCKIDPMTDWCKVCKIAAENNGAAIIYWIFSVIVSSNEYQFSSFVPDITKAGHMESILFCHSKNLLGANFCDIAAKCGKLELVKWGHNNGYSCQNVAKVACSNSHYDIAVWAIENKLFDNETVLYLTMCRHYDLLELIKITKNGN